MNPEFLGDSYDLVKRFFVHEFRALGYEVAVDPLFTGDWAEGEEEAFHRLIDVKHRKELPSTGDRTALFLDPDTGVKGRATRRHVSYDRLAHEAAKHRLVFAFDQSFSRQGSAAEAMARKLNAISSLGLAGLYYDSHARFLFASRQSDAIHEVWLHLQRVGIPSRRLIKSDA
jgi:hypothetical protein